VTHDRQRPKLDGQRIGVVETKRRGVDHDLALGNVGRLHAKSGRPVEQVGGPGRHAGYHRQARTAFRCRANDRTRAAARSHETPRCCRSPDMIEECQQAIDIGIADSQFALLR
jgi:hypothetical protein